MSNALVNIRKLADETHMIQHCLYLQFIVDDKLRDQLGLRRDSSEGIAVEGHSRRLTKPNMYTKEVKVDIIKLYHPLWVS